MISKRRTNGLGAALLTEFTRHQRSGRPLTVMQFDVTGLDGASRTVRRLTMDVLTTHCRRYDKIFEGARTSVLMLAPECSEEYAQGFRIGVSNKMRARGWSVMSGSATFPAHVSSIEGLLQASAPVDKVTLTGGAPEVSRNGRQVESASILGMLPDARTAGKVIL